MSELHLFETKHPNKGARAVFDGLVGLDEPKRQLIEELVLLLDASRIERWWKRHHPKGLAVVATLSKSAPLVLLSGEVGCGKTALATSVATPVAEELDARVLCLETPSNIRGTGLVGDISNRITAVFAMARSKLSEGARYGILVVDEADDLATSRAQLQAHHEDRAGLNVLVKQIDKLVREAPGLAVILITNRLAALDPAILRRAALHLTFRRPDKAVRHGIFAALLQGTKHTERDIDDLVERSEREDVPFSSSDLVHRVARSALMMARAADQPFSSARIAEALAVIRPTPLIDDKPFP